MKKKIITSGPEAPPKDSQWARGVYKTSVTAMQRYDVAAALIRRRFNVVCPLGGRIVTVGSNAAKKKTACSRVVTQPETYHRKTKLNHRVETNQQTRNVETTAPDV